jgi:hypothetical protein
MLTKKWMIFGGASVLVAGGAVAALAYFTANGSGTAPGTIGTSTSLVLHGTSGSTLYPGTSSSMSFTVDNASSGHALLGTIHLASVVACDSAFVSGACPNGHEISGCESVDNGSTSNANTSDFYMADVVANQDFPTGSGQSVTAPGTVTLNNLSSSQDSCKSAHLLFNLTS